MSQRTHLTIAGGGTGGHVMPALALADAVRAQWPHVMVDFIGVQRGLEATLLPQRGEQVLLLPMHAVQGTSVRARLRVLGWEVPRAVYRIVRSWHGAKPDLLVGVGGYASVGGVLAALLMGIPVVLYEQNAMPGLVNRTLARISKRVMLGFAGAADHLPQACCVVTGNSVRASIMAVQRSPHIPPRLLVMGGSQGARFLNEAIPAVCALLRQQERVFYVHHICGQKQDADAITANYAAAGVDAQVIPFCDDMAAFYAAGDVLIARAGAMTVSEVMACALPSIFIPLPSAADQHQHHNAAELTSCGAALLWEQDAYEAEGWAKSLGDILFNPLQLIKMRQALRQVAPDDPREQQLAVLSPWLEKTL